MKKIYPTLPGYSSLVLNVTESIYKFPNGSAIHIEGTDDPVKMHGYHCDILWFNESYNIQEATFNQLDMRCTGTVFLDLNPRQNHWSDNLQKKESTVLIHSTFRDNPFCPIQEKIKILSYQPIGMCKLVVDEVMTENEARNYDCIANELNIEEKRINELLRCKENEYTGSANAFDWSVYGLGIKGEKPHRIFRWHPISLEKYRQIEAQRYNYTDWGTVDPWAIGEAKYYDGALYVKSLNYLSENKLREIMTSTDRSRIESAEAGQEDSVGIVTWMFEKLGISRTNTIVCDSNRPLKIAFLRRTGWTQAVPTVKSPTSILDGISGLLNIKVYYVSDCLDIEEEQENYSWEVDSAGNVLEKPIDSQNHHIDGIRYLYLYLKSKGIIIET